LEYIAIIEKIPVFAKFSSLAHNFVSYWFTSNLDCKQTNAFIVFEVWLA
jgi:hypothetical protein